MDMFSGQGELNYADGSMYDPFLTFPALQYAPVPPAASPHAPVPPATAAVGSAACVTDMANSLKKTAWVSTELSAARGIHDRA